VKQWQETRDILERLAELTDSGQEAAVACVVQISGSAYRRPGARFLISADGKTLGGISGGCLEEDVRQNGLRALEHGRCRLLHYETGEDDDALWGLGLGCNGAVDVLVVPSTRPGFVAAAQRMRGLLDGDRTFAAVTIVDDPSGGDADLEGRVLLPGSEMHPPLSSGDEERDAALAEAADKALADKSSRLVQAGGVRAFVECFEPPPVAVVVGAGDDAMPLVAAAARAGFRVAVVDHRAAYLSPARFPDAWRMIEALPDDEAEGIPAGDDVYVVLKTHNLERDKAWARRFAAAPFAYLGLLGPRARCDEVAGTAAEVNEAAAGRIYGPVGLDLGAEGPEQVGVSVVAELLAVRSGRAPQHLRDRATPIHV
jgi:xanthine/CO dehydrogenase XdhC/CoxF family maturation factor